MNSWIFSMVWICAKLFLWFATFTPSERVALIAAFLVLVGVVGEYIIELDAIEKRERMRGWLKRLSMAFLVVGLSGDVLGIIMGQAETASLTKEAGDAKQSAIEAAREAKLAQGSADAASLSSGQALDKSIRADVAIRNALERIARARRETKKLHADELEIDRWLAKKALDREANLEDFEPLRRFKNMRAEIMYKEDDGEAYLFAGEIRGALDAVGWSVPSAVIPTRHNPIKRNESAPITQSWVLAKRVPHLGEVFDQMHLPDSQKWAISLLSRAIKGGWLEDPEMPDDKFVIVVGQNLRQYRFGEQ